MEVTISFKEHDDVTYKDISEVSTKGNEYILYGEDFIAILPKDTVLWVYIDDSKWSE